MRGGERARASSGTRARVRAYVRMCFVFCTFGGWSDLSLVLAEDEGAIESVGFFKTGVAEREMGHFGGFSVRGCVDDGKFYERGVESAELCMCVCVCVCSLTCR